MLHGPNKTGLQVQSWALSLPLLSCPLFRIMNFLLWYYFLPCRPCSYLLSFEHPVFHLLLYFTFQEGFCFCPGSLGTLSSYLHLLHSWDYRDYYTQLVLWDRVLLTFLLSRLVSNHDPSISTSQVAKIKGMMPGPHLNTLLPLYCFVTGSQYVTRAGLKLVILLSEAPKC
jgi:hypothetical protein